MAYKALVVDDDQTNRLILQHLLERDGFAVTTANDGAQAVDAFMRARFDVVLMDLLMPVMDGYEATRRIKAHATDRFTPVIFLTAVQDEQSLARCVDAGGDDFLSKPYNHVILSSKIRAMLRIGELHGTIRQQNEQLNDHQQLLAEEQRIAQRIFDGVVRAGNGQLAGVRCLLSPMSVFNGDLLLTARRSTGELHVLVGDFTGHGLSAAVGAVPVSDIFYSMTSNGFSVGDIAEAINRKLKQILPANIFFAASLLAIDALEKKLVVWNGGMPEVLVVDKKNTILQRARSLHLPLGVLAEAVFDRGVEIFSINFGERIYACSDGVIDAPIATGGRFTREGYEECFGPHVSPELQFDWIVDSLHEIHGEGPEDDLTLLEVTVSEQLASVGVSDAPARQRQPSSNWQVNFDLSGPTLRQVDPVPLLMRVFSEVQGLERHKEILYTVLAELVSNAVEHGILQLDSAIKSSPAGFASYYGERDARLAQLENGYLRVMLNHDALTSGGRLTVRVDDSGPGFDHLAATAGLDTNQSASGRGIRLLRTLCEKVEYAGNGNSVEVSYLWKA